MKYDVRNLYYDVLMIVVVLFILATPFDTKAEMVFAPKERELMELARTLGEDHDLAKAAMGVLVVESTVGRGGAVGDHHLPVGQRSYGPMQIRFDTAKEILARHPDLDPKLEHDYQLVEKLAEDERWNIMLAVKHLDWLRNEKGLTWRETLVAYNEGLTGARRYDPQTHPYAQKVAEAVTKGPVKDYMNTLTWR